MVSKKTLINNESKYLIDDGLALSLKYQPFFRDPLFRNKKRPPYFQMF